MKEEKLGGKVETEEERRGEEQRWVGGDGCFESPDNHQVWFHKRSEWSWLTAQLSPPHPPAPENTTTRSLTWEHMWERRYLVQCRENLWRGAAPNST